jgi:hypothetical protein
MVRFAVTLVSRAGPRSRTVERPLSAAKAPPDHERQQQEETTSLGHGSRENSLKGDRLGSVRIMAHSPGFLRLP